MGLAEIHFINLLLRFSHIIKAKLSWSRTRAKFCQSIASLSVILLQLKLDKSQTRSP